MVDIVLAVNSGSVGYVRAMVNSIRANVRDPYIHLLTDGDFPQKSWFDNVVVVGRDLLKVDGPYRRITNHTYYRLYIDRLLPQLTKCIYLDWDVIVLKDISDLLDGSDWLIKGVSINGTGYLNAGVIALNLTDECRACMDIARERIGLSPDDQDCLNRGFADKTTMVSFDYNCMLGCIEPTESTRVLHYLGPHKPWHSHPAVRYWFDYGGCDK